MNITHLRTSGDTSDTNFYLTPEDMSVSTGDLLLVYVSNTATGTPEVPTVYCFDGGFNTFYSLMNLENTVVSESGTQRLSLFSITAPATDTDYSLDITFSSNQTGIAWSAFKCYDTEPLKVVQSNVDANGSVSNSLTLVLGNALQSSESITVSGFAIPLSSTTYPSVIDATLLGRRNQASPNVSMMTQYAVNDSILASGSGSSSVFWTGIITEIGYAAVATTGTVSRSSEYSVNYYPTISRNAAYTVFELSDITKSSQYAVGMVSSVGISSGYAVEGSQIQKKFFAKVYSPQGVFRGSWHNILVKDFEISREINTNGSAVTLELSRKADDYGEGVDVDYRNRVEIYVVDKEAPNGLLYFTGFISYYKPDYATESVEISLFSYGRDMTRTILEDSSGNTVIDYFSVDPSDMIRDILDKFQASGGVVSYLGQVKDVENRNFITNPSFEIDDVNTSVITFNGVVASGSVDTTTAAQGTNSYRIDVSASAETARWTAQVSLGEFAIEDNKTYTFSFYAKSTDSRLIEMVFEGETPYYPGTNPTTTAWQRYSGTFTATTADSVTLKLVFNTGAAGSMWIDGLMIEDSAGVSPYFDGDTAASGSNVYEWEGAAHASISRHSVVRPGNSIDNTGTVASYSFNTVTVKEAIDKVLQLAPIGWYYYIDQATNIFHWHERGVSYDHSFAIGRDLKLLSIRKSIEPVVNVLYFSGGDIGGGVNLYKKYTLPSSIENYGIQADRYKDGRVTLIATADIIAQKVLRGDPEILVEVEIVDSNNNNLGYDLESIHEGDMVKIGSSGIGASSQYDFAKFDESPYDYDLTNLSSIIFQVTGLTYTGDSVKFTLSTTPPDITKRIQDISRNLTDIQNSDNPDAPVT